MAEQEKSCLPEIETDEKEEMALCLIDRVTLRERLRKNGVIG